MSYDVRIGVKVAGTENLYAVIAVPDHHSPTYNLGKMFRACTGWDFVQGRWYPCADVVPMIEHGIHELKFYPDKYRCLEPDNGWGSVESARKALESMLECIYHEVSGDRSWNQIPLECLYVCW